MAEQTWLQIITDAFLTHRKPLAYTLVIGTFCLRLTPWPIAPHITLVALALIILPILFEIHKKVTSDDEPTVFESFDSAMTVLGEELNKIADKPGTHTIRYLGLTLAYWHQLEHCLTGLLRRTRVPRLHLQIVMIDPHWNGVDALNPVWRAATEASAQWVNQFNTRNKAALEANGWSIEIRYYRSTPNLFGILIDESTLFTCNTYWDNGTMRGGQNPTDLFKADGNRFGSIRIAEFLGWFGFHWKQDAAADAPNE